MLAGLFAATIVAGYAHTHYAGVFRSDDYEYASIARNVLRGDGVTTQHLYPIDIMLWERVPHPDFMHPPGMATLIAGSFRIFGVHDFAAVLPSMVAFVLLAVITLLLADTLFDGVARWIAVVLLSTHPALLDYAVQALSELPATLCFTLAVLLALRARSLPVVFAAGLGLGAAQLLRESFIVTLPGFLLLFLLTSRGTGWRTRSAVFLCGFATCVAILVVRSLAVTGAPWTSYAPISTQAFTSVYPGLDILRHVSAEPLPAFLEQHGWEFTRKVARNLAAMPVVLVGAVGPAASVLAVFFAWQTLRVARARASRETGGGTNNATHGNPSTTAHALLLASLAMIAVSGLAVASFVAIERHQLVFVPLVVVLAAGGAAMLIDDLRRGHRRRAAASLLLAAAAAIFFDTASTPTQGRDPRHALQEFVRQTTPAGAVIASDLPEAAIWLADRSAVWIPLTTGAFENLTRTVAVDYVLLTGERTPFEDESWSAVYAREHALQGFELAAAFEGVPRALLFSATGD